MNRATLLSAVLTKRGVIVALVVGAGLLGAGLGVLPGLLDSPTDGPAGPATETTQETTTTQTSPGDDSGDPTTTDDADIETTPVTATTESSDATGLDSSTDNRTTTTTSAETGEGTDDVDHDWFEDDESAEVNVQAETNATVASRSVS